MEANIRLDNLKTIIDIGAGVGEFSNEMLKFNPDCKVYCFEPIPETYELLKAWASGRDNVKTFNVALGKDEGTREINWCINDKFGSSMLETIDPAFGGEKKKLEIFQTTLDSIMADKVIEKDILVKIDVEGIEDRVIEGGKSLISNAKVCMIEVHLLPKRKNQATFKDIYMLMDSLGFEYCGNATQSMADNYTMSHIDALFKKYVKKDIKKD